jgi:heavy metal sensor kinase
VRRRRPPLSVRTRLTLWYTSLLFAILAVVTAFSYSLLARNLAQDLDQALLNVATVVRDAGRAFAGAPEPLLRQTLGADFTNEFLQLREPDGTVRFRSAHLRGDELPLSATARAAAGRGVPTFETVTFRRRQTVRFVTLPDIRDGRLEQFVQVGVSQRRTEQTLAGYLETVVVIVPLGLGLAGVGGAIMARAALRPVDEMARAARRITAEALRERVAVRGTGDELDRLAETLNSMLARLEETFAGMRRFSADAAHELRTPLTALKGELEVALRAERSPAEYRRALWTCLEEVDALIALAEDLLLMARSSAGLDGARTRVPLDTLALDAADAGMKQAAGTGVTVRVEALEPLSVEGDERTLRRAVLNLIDNAVKYTPRGGVVTVTVTGAGSRARLSVGDTGPGIRPEEAERIFLPFVRLDEARVRTTGGAGLGLTIARSIVAAHGGTLTVEPGTGRGATFTIVLPLA